MQYQMSTAPGLAPPPESPPLSPAVVPNRPKAPRPRPWWIFGLGLIGVVALGYYLWTRQNPAPATAGSPGLAAVRTASIGRGNLIRTIRLTGSTGAEKFASLLVPQLRGSRSDGLREAKLFTSPGADFTVTPNNGKSSTSSSSTASASTSSTGSSGTGSSDGQVASTMGQSNTGQSAALQSATSRVGGSNRSGGSGSLTPSAPPPISTALGDQGLGSTSTQLAGTGGSPGGGPGNGGDFGLVLQSAAKPGARVRKGEQVAEFDRQSMLNRLDDYRAAVAQMDASFAKLKAEVEVQRRAHAQSVENAKAALDQATLDLKTIPVLGAIEAERTRLAAEEANAKYKQLLAEVKFVEAGYASQVRIAELQLQQAHLELKRAEMNADRMLMKAPIDGLVVMQSIFRGTDLGQIQEGDQLWPGMRFVQIVDPSSMIVNATVNQVDADTIRVGSKAKIHFDAFPDLELPATIHAIGAMTKPGGMRGSYVKEIPVLIKIDKLDPRVIPDLSVSIDVEIASVTDAVIAPLSSIFHDETGAHSTWVLVKNGDSWKRRDVEVGIASNLEAAIKSGLQPGEVVAVERPPEQAVKGQG